MEKIGSVHRDNLQRYSSIVTLPVLPPMPLIPVVMLWNCMHAGNLYDPFFPYVACERQCR